MKEIKNKDSIGYADMLWIVFDDKCVHHFLHDESALHLTFEQVMQLACENGYTEGVIMLIAESPLAGKVYQYGNYGPYWVNHGTTNGYA